MKAVKNMDFVSLQGFVQDFLGGGGGGEFVEQKIDKEGITAS